MGLFDLFKKKEPTQPTTENAINLNTGHSNAPKIFVCSKCGKELAMKYMHRNNICTNCASDLPVPKPTGDGNSSSHTNPLDEMTELIISDCQTLGVPEYKINAYLKNELCQNPDKGGEYILFDYNLKGYSITYWERGRCGFGFGSKNPMDFRFLFQLNIANNLYSYSITTKNKTRAEEFMKKTKSLFGETAEYKKALSSFTRTWNDFDYDSNTWRKQHYLSKYDVGNMKTYLTEQYPQADESSESDGFRWKRYGQDVVLIAYTQSEAIVCIPKTIKGYAVKGISETAFLNKQITDIYIPHTIEYIGAVAIGFVSETPYTEEEEKCIAQKQPFAHNCPTNTLQDLVFYLHSTPKTVVHGNIGSVAEEYARIHNLPFSSEKNLQYGN